MKRLFQYDIKDENFKIYQDVINRIKLRTETLVDEIDSLIINYTENNIFETRFFLNELTDVNEKINYLKKLREKILKMNDCDKVTVKIATPLHPMCWAYYLSKKWPKKFKNYIMYGFCVPFYPSRPIMLAHYVFEKGIVEVFQILVHELTHSLMNAKDLNATNYKDAINDAWTICFMY